MHSDVLILKWWFAVHRMLQGCATNSVSFSPTGCSSWGLSPIASDKLRPCLPPFSCTRFYFPTFLFISFSFLSKLTSCSCAAAYSQCALWAYTSAVLCRPMYDTFENRSFERLFKACYSVSSVYVEGQSLLFFCLAPEKWGIRYPPIPKRVWGG